MLQKWMWDLRPALVAAKTDEEQWAIWRAAIEREEAAGRTVPLMAKFAHLGPPRPSEKDLKPEDGE